MISETSQNLIANTEYWLKNLIIDHQLCPFAGSVFASGRLRYFVNQNLSHSERLQSLIAECIKLDKASDIETTLFICAVGLEQFDDYLDFLELANQLLIAQGFEGILQLASFHPDYCFADTDPSDPSNFTNRSPYPMLHILQEASIEQAIRSYPNPENIPKTNIALTRELGADKLKALLSACFQTKA